MIKSICLKNIQSHHETLIEFHPSVNIIIGKSRSGKTTILRAIRKVWENRPVIGMERWIHKHNPKNTMEVELKTIDDHTVAWINTSPQKYIVDGQPLTGFGQGVPQQVTNVLNLADVNIQDQHDRPYLLFDTPGEVARTLNKAVNLDIIDIALANAANLKRQNDQDLRVQDSKLKDLLEQEVSFPDLKAAEEYIVMLEGWQTELNDKRTKIAALTDIQKQLTNLRSSLAKAKVPDGVETQVGSMTNKQKELEQKTYTLAMLRQKQNELSTLRNQQDSLKVIVGQDGWVSELLTRNQMLIAKRRNLVRIKSLNDNITKSRQSLELKQTIINQREKEFKQLMPQICPLCEQEIK